MPGLKPLGTHLQTCTHAHAPTHTHTHAHTYIHAYIHWMNVNNLSVFRPDAGDKKQERINRGRSCVQSITCSSYITLTDPCVPSLILNIIIYWTLNWNCATLTLNLALLQLISAFWADVLEHVHFVLSYWVACKLFPMQNFKMGNFQENLLKRKKKFHFNHRLVLRCLDVIFVSCYPSGF